MTIDERIRYYIERKAPVFIYYNNDLEENVWLYSVQVCGTEFWMNSFEKEEDAIKFCNDNGLPIE